jgi:hypothetical protein
VRPRQSDRVTVAADGRAAGTRWGRRKYLDMNRLREQDREREAMVIEAAA